jgi:hypothetical protein
MHFTCLPCALYVLSVVSSLRRAKSSHFKEICSEAVQWIQVAQESNRLSWTWQWTFGVHKRRRIYWGTEKLSASQYVSLHVMRQLVSYCKECKNYIITCTHAFVSAKNVYIMTAFWDIEPYSLTEVQRSSNGAYCFHHQGERNIRWRYRNRWDQVPS